MIMKMESGEEGGGGGGGEKWAKYEECWLENLIVVGYSHP